MALYDCLKPAVGLSEVDCACTTTDRPEDYNTSASGYYMDDLEHGVPLIYPQSAQDCGTGNLWELMERARKAGVNEFAERMNKGLTIAKRPMFSEFNGWIGDEKHSSLIPSNNLGPIVGVRLRPTRIKGGKIRIRKISLAVSALGTYTVSVYDANDLATPLQSYEVPVSNANNHNVFELPSELVLDATDKGDQKEYFFLYARGASQPRNTLFTCGCGSNQRGWMPYFSYQNGVSLDTVTEAASPKYTTTATMGLRIFANLECDGTEFLCSDHLEFDKPDYGKVIAKVIQLLSINKLIHGIMSSQRINIYTMMNGDMLMEKMARNSEIIDNNITWLAQNLPESLTDCYRCRKNSIMGTIRVS